MTRPGEPYHVLFVCSGGGHLAQLVQLRPWWEQHRRTWVTFDTTDSLSLLAGERVIVGHHPTTRNIPNLLRNLLLAVGYFRRASALTSIMSDGAGVAVPFFWLGELLRLPDRVPRGVRPGRLRDADRHGSSARSPTSSSSNGRSSWRSTLAPSSPARCTDGSRLDRSLRQRRNRPPPVRPPASAGPIDGRPTIPTTTSSCSTAPPRRRPTRRVAHRLPYPEMLAELAAADVVVVSCGPGAVMDAPGRPVASRSWCARRCRTRRARRRPPARVRPSPPRTRVWPVAWTTRTGSAPSSTRHVPIRRRSPFTSTVGSRTGSP